MRPSTSVLARLALAGSLSAQDRALLRSAVDKLRTQKAGPQDIGPDAPVRRSLKGKDLSTQPWELLLLASEWHLRAQMLAAGTPLPLPAPAHPDLVQAWDLLHLARQKSQQLQMNVERNLYRGSDAKLRAEAAAKVSDGIQVKEVRGEFRKALDWVALETAVRLQDGAKAAAALKDLASIPELSPREQGLAFMAAGYAGSWERLSTLGDVLAGTPGLMAQLRALSAASPAMPDFTALLDLVRADLPAELEAEQARWAIRDLRYRFQEAQCADPAQAARMKAAYAEAPSTGPLEGPVVRTGAVLHWTKPGAAPLPMSGPAEKGRLRLQGRATVVQDGVRLERVETLDLRQDPANPSRWRGTQRTEQTVLEGQAPPARTYVLELAVEGDLEAAR